jgi:hypothetical protein
MIASFRILEFNRHGKAVKRLSISILEVTKEFSDLQCFCLNVPGDVEFINSIKFIDRTRRSLAQLNGTKLANTEIEAIGCYLTGTQCGDGNFNIAQYAVSDNHGLQHKVYNAKLNIHRHNDDTIYLGIQDHAMDEFAKNKLIQSPTPAVVSGT